MKLFNKHILEAINRGIKLALDDYEELLNDFIAPKKNVIKNGNSVKELLWINENFIDLKLPSGTLWGRYNLGVDPKKLNPKNLKSYYGNYYAWGETETKKDYISKTYKLRIGRELTKYNKKDNLTKLLPEDDVAYQFDNRMNIPSKELFDELLEYTTNEWIENYLKIEDLNGMIFTSKINGKLLFIPASGYKYQKSVFNASEYFGLWSSNLYVNDLYDAWHIFFDYNDVSIDHSYRSYGLTIRPVLNRN